MTDPARLIHTPLGQPGSGRVRYGAAMALREAGQMSDAALEVYRVCSPLDQQDPAPLLRAAGQSVPVAPATDGATALRWLLDEAAAYFATLSGPGVAEIRTNLGQWAGNPIADFGSAPNAVIDTHLSPALRALAPTHPALAAAIGTLAPLLPWITYDLYPKAEIGPSFGTSHAYVSLIGQEAPIWSDQFDLGLFLIAPHVLYRDHRHRAVELYAPMTGPHGWRFGPDQPLTIKPAHQPAWNPSMQPHLTKVGPIPFLSFFGWTGDLTSPAEVIPARDWAELEALRLG